MKCYCCGRPLPSNMKCQFCGLQHLETMLNQDETKIDKQNIDRAETYRSKQINRLTDFSVTLYEASGKDLVWSVKPVETKIADGKDCDGKPAVLDKQLGFNTDSIGELALTYKVDKKERKLNVNIKKPSKISSGLGLQIERDFSLSVFLGKDKVGTAELSLQ